MKKTKLHIALLLLFSGHILSAQNATNIYDGILMKSSSVNRTEFYYGETINLFFETINTENTVKNYDKFLYAFGNYKMSLTNLRTGSELLYRGGASLAFIEGHINAIKAGKSVAPFEPLEWNWARLTVSDNFGSTGPAYLELSQSLLALPVGEYEYTILWNLYPGTGVLKVSHQFRIIELPVQEKVAHQQYIEACKYVEQYSFLSEEKYDENHPNSFESFIRNHPNSVFAQRALLSMNSTFTGVKEELIVKRGLQYRDVIAKLTLQDLKFEYCVKHLTRTLVNLKRENAINDVKKEMDNALRLLKNDPLISKGLIHTAENSGIGIKGLKDYSQGRGEKD